jgi:hypothetical protein
MYYPFFMCDGKFLLFTIHKKTKFTIIISFKFLHRNFFIHRTSVYVLLFRKSFRFRTNQHDRQVVLTKALLTTYQQVYSTNAHQTVQMFLCAIDGF